MELKMLIMRSETQEELPGMELGSISKMSGKEHQSSNMDGRTDPTFFNLHSAGAIHRDLGEVEATGRRKRGQPGSHAKLLPGSKALLDSEKQFSFHLSFDP